MLGKKRPGNIQTFPCFNVQNSMLTNRTLTWTQVQTNEPQKINSTLLYVWLLKLDHLALCFTRRKDRPSLSYAGQLLWNPATALGYQSEMLQNVTFRGMSEQWLLYRSCGVSGRQHVICSVGVRKIHHARWTQRTKSMTFLQILAADWYLPKLWPVLMCAALTLSVIALLITASCSFKFTIICISIFTTKPPMSPV